VGAGPISETRIEVQMDGIAAREGMEIVIYGIEMVWVNAGGFWLGDGASNNTFARGDSALPYYVGSAESIAVGTGADQLNGSGAYAPTADIPATWPNGFDGFYCMKYELSQAQYADFLNALTFEQQAARTSVAPDEASGTVALQPTSPNRNGIRILTPGVAQQGWPAAYAHNLDGTGDFNDGASGETRACNWLDWDDMCAYLDWAALRPMTEMEYEKAARGPDSLNLAWTYAWGTDEVVDANTLMLDGTSREVAVDKLTENTGLASHGYDGPQGPLRCGFAADAGTNRVSAGAGYFGAMELSGNLWELCVTVNAAGLAFTGALGDGELSADGEANASDWPGSEGAGFRGGAWNSGIQPTFRDLAVSDRFYAGLPPVIRRNTAGGRGVR
ncbi:MAG: SUMF1/EgtB/PvdO family nonheme iron enzyme, partial [Bacteroidota bacterium]